MSNGDFVGFQQFYGRGKLLLTGEYFVLDGALSLALPTQKGQRMSVTYRRSFDPKLYWKAFDYSGKSWIEATMDFWNFDLKEGTQKTNETLLLQKVLRQARRQNIHFLRDNVDDVYVETQLEFPSSWGLGSSSTLVYNVAQWAYIGPFELQFKTLGGSGYDIACAQSDGPILYEKKNDIPKWEPSKFDPPFKENLYFIYLGRKQSTLEGIEFYKTKIQNYHELVIKLSYITREFINVKTVPDFEFLIHAHEKIISSALEIPRAQDLYFEDYWGAVKSLGAWGGDFALATSTKSSEETINYFKNKGIEVVVPYREMIFEKCLPKNLKDETLH